MIRRLLPVLICGLSLLNAPPASAAPERPRDFAADAMVSGSEGWAQTGRGLYWTADGGQSWRNITPPLEHPARLGSVHFADPDHGWAEAEEGREGHNRVALFATGDGGRSWSRTRVEVKGLATNAAGASFAPVGTREVFALVGEARNTAFSVGYLLVSHDGGRHWHQLPRRPPHAGQIVFTGPRDGWLAGGGPHPALYRTRDGGHSWSEVDLPRPPGDAAADAGYLAPQFGPGGGGILAAGYDNRGEQGTAVLYTTTDDGAHWTLASSAKLSIEGSGSELLAYRGEDSLFVQEYPPPRLALLSTGAAPTPFASIGLPEEFFPYLSFSGPEDGFALIDGEECVRKVRCTTTNQLYFSDDGGQSWAPVRRP